MIYYNYRVEYALDGVSGIEVIRAASPGEAFAKLLKLKPKAELVSAWLSGEFLGATGEQVWYPPKSNQELKPEPRPPRPLKRDNRDCIFPFYDEVKSTKRV